MPSRIGDALHWFATYTPEKIAIISNLGSQTYEQLWSRVRRLANSLAKTGIKPGDRVALLMQNSSRYLELYQAAALMGVAVVPLNFRFVASEIEYVVNHSGAKRAGIRCAFAETSIRCGTDYCQSGERISSSDGPGGDGTYSL